MESPDCDHDFRRVYPSTLRGEYRENGEPVLAILCCECGVSPLTMLRKDEPLPRFEVNGDWPDDRRISEWLVSDIGVPSVEIVSGPRT